MTRHVKYNKINAYTQNKNVNKVSTQPGVDHFTAIGKKFSKVNFNVLRLKPRMRLVFKQESGIDSKHQQNDLQSNI